MFAHKAIDALRGTARSDKLEPMLGIDNVRLALADGIERAEKFDFGRLTLEAMEEEGRWKVPELTQDEKDFWSQGLIPLPANGCWFEFVLGGSPSAFYVFQADDNADWVVARVDHKTASIPQSIYTDGCLLVMHKESFFRAGGGSVAGISGNTEFLDAVRRTPAHYENLTHEMLTCGLLTIYLALMINSRTTEVHAGPPPPPALNKKRASKGLAPLPEHRVVRIVPERFTYEHDAAGKRTHRSPRLHWRRSHLRHYADGKVIVIARMLVGRAELGTVSHEYKIG